MFVFVGQLLKSGQTRPLMPCRCMTTNDRIHSHSTLMVWRCSLTPATERASHAPHPIPSQWPCHRQRRSCSWLQQVVDRREVRSGSSCRPCLLGEGFASRHHSWCMSWTCQVHSTRRRIGQGSGQQHRPSVDERVYAPTCRAPSQAWIQTRPACLVQ